MSEGAGNPVPTKKFNLLERFGPAALRTMKDMRRCLLLLFLWCLVGAGLLAEAPAFDLSGPRVDVHVKRGEITLPIGEVPNLQPGDRLWVHPDLPESQSTHFVLVVAFLRGATNPPPDSWFTRVETWNRQVRDEGVFVTVPAEAQQALIFLAPETGGDFSTLRSAVRGRPGAFVRATQDLQAASLDRMRLDTYLAEVKVNSQTDTRLLKERASLAARSLGIRLDKECFDKPSDQQAPCLVEHTDGLVLDDSGVQSKVEQIANSPGGDLMNQLSYSPMAGAGEFSPYVGAIVDTARILASLHTAHFQYIPALALPIKDTLNLRLNVPPSFRDPKSVVVVALPPVDAAKLPPLHPVDPQEHFCAQKPGLVLPAEGAPVVYSTQLAYDLNLHIESNSAAGGSPIDIPVKTDPSQGGLVPIGPLPQLPQGDLTAVLRGKWGFDNWEGPRYYLRSAQPGRWVVSPGDQSALVIGREDTIHFEGDSALCVDRVAAAAQGLELQNLQWSSPHHGSLNVSVPLKQAPPGPVNLEIYQYGLEAPELLTLRAYAEAASLDRLSLAVGDPVALLRGRRLDEVASADLDGIPLIPSVLSRVRDFDQLALTAGSSTTALDPTQTYEADVRLQDGRQLTVPVTVQPPRPQITLLNKGVQEDPTAAPAPVHISNPDDLPVEGHLVFFVKSRVPVNFPRTQKLEVAAVDGSFSTVLSLSGTGLMLEDARTAMGSLDPLAAFGTSAFGPIQIRAMSADGVTGDWLPLGTLVRLPGFKELHCQHSPAKPCQLTGSNLFLAASVGNSPDLAYSTDVPPDFTGTQLSVPHPVNGILYVRLRDDPATVQTLTLPLSPAAAPATAQAPSAVSAATDKQGASIATVPLSTAAKPNR